MSVRELRTALLDDMQHYRAALLASIDGLDEQRMTERTIDGWSVKDPLAHLAWWDEQRYFAISRLAAGQGPSPSFTENQVETLNALMREHREGLSLGQVLWELEFARAKALEAIAACPEGRLTEAEARTRAGVRHDRDHTEQLRAWRERAGI